MITEKVLPKRKSIRLPADTYANPSHVFTITINAFERRRYFSLPQFNREIIASLREEALKCECSMLVYCLMPTHLHLLIRPGKKTLVEFIAEFKKRTSDLARRTRHIRQLWQRSFFDHRLRSHESAHAQYEYIRMNPVRAGLAARPEDWPWTGSVQIPAAAR